MAELVEEGPNKRPRLWEQQQQQQQQDAGRGCQQDGWEVGGGGEDSATCVCSNTGCPWRFRSSRTSPTSRATGAAGSTNGPSPTPVVEPTDGDGDEDESGRLLPPRQVFDGPLLSVKEYRDEPTGEVRFAVFQGDRRMSVAQILFSLNQEENDHSYGHVKSVRVHRDFRGMGLGPLLFKEVFATLGNLSVTEVRLDAEEDMCKYNHLVRYYEDLGFRRLEGSKVHYVHHSDQVYRKIPMLRQVSAPPQPRFRRLPRLVDNGGWFLVVRLQTKAGGFVRSTASGNVVPPHSHAAGAGGSAAAAVACGGCGGGGGGGCSAPASGADTAWSGAEVADLGADAGDGFGGGGGGCEVEGCCGGSGGAPAGGRGAAAGCSAGVGGGGGGGGGAAGGLSSAGGRNGAAAAEKCSAQSGGGVRGRRRMGGDERATGARRSGRGGDADALWTLTVSEVRGVVCFESAYGKYLCVEPDGRVVADRSWDDSWEQFSLERFAPDVPESSALASSRPDGVHCASTAEEKSTQEHSECEGRRDTSSAEATRQTTAPAPPPQSSAASSPCGADADADGSGGGLDRREGSGGGGGGGGGGVAAGGGNDGDALESGEACRGTQGRTEAEASSSSVSESSRGGLDRTGVGGGVPTTRFALRTYHGQYLSLDAEFGTVSTSAQPVLWSTDEKNSICHCEGTVPWATPPPASRRQVALQAHLRSMRQVQNVAFVTGTRNKYMSSFGRRGRFSVKDALDLLDRHRDPLQSTRLSRLSFAALLVLTAQDIRDEGLPDWMQAIGLVHGLGRILHFLGEDAGVTETERECVLGEYSWVVGAPFPDSIACASYNVDNDDVLDERYGAGGARPTGMYDKASGLENALLCFTGPEYMYMVLRNHGTNIPPQGLAMLRLYPLEPWHAGGCYSDLESVADKDTKNAVRQFDAIRRATLHSTAVQRREVNLERAWYEHLKDLVDKFFPGDLAW